MEAYIKEIVPFSSQHWPEQNCVVVKFVGNNFRIPYSKEPEILDFKDEYLSSIRNIQEQITSQLGTLKHVFFCGGEPTLQQEALLKLAQFCKESNLKVGIGTNGTKYFTIKKLVEQKVIDFIRLEIPAPLDVHEIFEKVTRSRTFFTSTKEIVFDIKKTIQFLHEIKKEEKTRLDIEILTTIVPGLLFRKEDLAILAKDISQLECEWILNQFYRTDQDKLLDKRYEGIKFPSRGFLDNLRKSLQTEYPYMRIAYREYVTDEKFDVNNDSIY